MGGLHHVGSVHVVVVGDVGVVVVLQSHHEGDEGVVGNLEGFQEVSFLTVGGGRSAFTQLSYPLLTKIPFTV